MSCSTWRWGSSRSASASGVRLFVRRDPFDRFVVVPRVPAARPLQHGEPRARRADPCETFGGARSTGRAAVGVGARAHPLHRPLASGPASRATTSPRSRRGSSKATRAWTDDLREALIEEHGEEAGLERFQRYARAFPPGYREPTGSRAPRSPTSAGSRSSSEPSEPIMSLYRPLEAPEGMVRCKLFSSAGRARCRTCCRCSRHGRAGHRRAPVRDRRRAEREPVWIYDFGFAGAPRSDVERGARALPGGVPRRVARRARERRAERLVLDAG